MSKMSTAERQQQQILQRPPTASVTNQRQECRPIKESSNQMKEKAGFRCAHWLNAAVHLHMLWPSFP